MFNVISFLKEGKKNPTQYALFRETEVILDKFHS